jgi:hypothetical protein
LVASFFIIGETFVSIPWGGKQDKNSESLAIGDIVDSWVNTERHSLEVILAKKNHLASLKGNYPEKEPKINKKRQRFCLDNRHGKTRTLWKKSS